MPRRIFLLAGNGPRYLGKQVNPLKFFRKTLAVCLMLTVLSFSFAAFAEESTETSPLPCGVRFGMSLNELSALLGENALIETWDEDAGTGSASMENVDTGIGDLTADYITFQADRNNSAGKSRLSMISMSLPVQSGAVPSFRAALETLTAVYGAPDSDPFDENGVENYVENGDLSATWTRDDVRFTLTMSRMYGDTLTFYYSYRLNYDADDLK